MCCIEYKLVQIRKDGDRADARWHPRACSGSEVLNQLLSPVIERTFRKICLYGISKLPTRESHIDLLWFALDARAILAFSIRIYRLLTTRAAITAVLPR